MNDRNQKVYPLSPIRRQHLVEHQHRANELNATRAPTNHPFLAREREPKKHADSLDKEPDR